MKFDQAVEVILDIEKGFVNNPNDPGGATNFGISQRSYPNLNIRELTREQAIELYRKDFWELAKIDLLPPYLRLAVFDTTIIQGPSVAIGLLQAALGVKVDSDLGPLTLSALAKTNPEKMLLKYMEFRFDRMSKARNFAYYAEGWGNRLVRIAVACAQRFAPETPGE